MPGGSLLPFIDNGSGNFSPYFGVTAQMSQITPTGGSTYFVVTATNQTVYAFNASGLVTQTVSPAGHVITYTYYPTGPLQSAQSYGRFLNFAYDGSNRLMRATDPINRSTQFGYDVNGDLAIVTDTRGLTWTYQYSGATHLLNRVIDPDGKTVERTEFDAQGRAIKQYNGNDQLIVELTFGSNGVITVTDGLTHSSVDRYGRGTWLGGADAAGKPLTRTYDLNFKPALVADQNGNETQMLWNAGGSNLERIVDAAGMTTTLSYDSLNNLTRTVDARGAATQYFYSGTLLISQTDALSNTWIYTYGLNNLLIAQQDPLSRTTRYEYNAFGQRIAMTDALTHVTRYAYDNVGRLITTTDALGKLTVNAYDNADQLIAVTENYTSTSSEPNYLNTYNRITRYAYDGFGRQVLVTDTLDRMTLNRYDAAGRLVSATVNYSPTLLSFGPNYLNQYNLMTQYGYDTAGKPILLTDTLGFVTRTEYDSLNRPITVTTNYKNGVFDPARPDEDLIRVTGYDAAGNVITQTDALGPLRVTRTFYDKLNRPISTSVNYSPTLPQNANGEYNLVTQYAYDEVGSTILVTDTLNRVTRNFYDALGRVVSTTVNYSPSLGVNHLNQYNLTTRYQYDKAGNRVVVTDPLTNTSRYAYDDLNRVITTTDMLSGTSVTVYDAVGNRIKSIDALGHTTVYTYDAAYRLAASSTDAGQTTRYAYDALGNTRVVTDANDNPTKYSYDALNRVITTTDALTGTTVFGYDALSRRIVMTDANTHATWTAYDGVGRPVTTTDALGNFAVVGYDALGNRVKMTDGLGHTTVYTYDLVNRLIAQADPLINVTRYKYDALGSRTVMTDANAVVTQYGYDALNRLAVVTESVTSTLGLDPNTYNLVTRYDYDAIGNRTVITNARGYTTTYTYDALYRMISMRDPLSNTTRYGYDAVGNRTVMTDANSAVITYTYDAANRLTRTGYPNSSVTYAYDKLGNRLVMTDALGATRYTYDQLNRLTHVVDPFSQPVTYTFDAVGNRTGLKYPDGKAITYTFDVVNRLTTVTDWSSQATTYAYDKANRLITTTLPNGVRSVNSYDNADRLTRLTHARNNGSYTLGDYQFTLDKLGNRTAVTEVLATAVNTDTIFADGFESGNFSAWSAAVTDGGDLAVSLASAQVGTYGMRALIDDTIDIYLRDDTPNAEPRYRARFYFDPHSVSIPDAALHELLEGRNASVDVFRVRIRNSGGSYQIRAQIRTDAGTYSNTSWYTISDASHFIEIDWQASTAAGANNGYISLWIDDVLKQTVSAVDNDTLRIDQARLGPTNIASGTSGTERFDAFESRTTTYIGPANSDPALLTTTIAYGYDPLYRLTGATATGAYSYTFVYAYDPVGNRTLSTELLTQTITESVIFDIAASADDAYYAFDSSGGVLVTSGSALLMGHNNDGGEYAGYRFDRVLLPAGALPNWSAAEFRLTSATDTPNTVGLRLYGEDYAAAPDYAAGYPYDSLPNRQLISASAEWPAGAWEADQVYSVNVNEIVEKIMGRPGGWSNGNPIALQVRGVSGDGQHAAWSVDGDPTRSAQLVMTYTVYVPAGAQHITATVLYGYDAANRLIKRNGHNIYTWDNNGNMLSDGSTGAVYAYDFANRLISTTLSGVNTQFGYNGDGVRLRQVAAGTLTTYTQDYAAPLPVVLQAKIGSAATQYVYSLGTRPLSEYEATAWEYLLPDPLGSVRQIANNSGNVTLLKSYEPYGSRFNSEGSAASIFGYAGEQQDAYTKLLFLRARYYDPNLGQFLSEDSVSGDALLPRSLHIYAYAWNNPVNLLDPNGQQVPPPKCDPGAICYTGTTGPYVVSPPQFGSSSVSPSDPLTPERWQLSKQEAQRFQIPVELVAGTVAAEIIYDTDFWESFIDTSLLKLPLAILYCPDTANADKWAAKLWLDWYNSRGQTGTGPGPGVANVHVATAIAAEDWINTYYPGRGLLDKPENVYIRLANLVLDDGNIRYTAGILRQLADQRTSRAEPHVYEPAPKSNPTNLTDLDMQMIYQGFRGSIEGYYGSIDAWRKSDDPNPGGKGFGHQIASFLPYYRERVKRGE